MDHNFDVEDWLICPNCLDEHVLIQNHKYMQGVEVICKTCGAKSHKTGSDMKVDIDL